MFSKVEDKVLISLDLEMFDQITGFSSNFFPKDVALFENLMFDFFDMLDKHNVTIIIFAVGEIVEKFPTIIDRALKSGHFLGWHSSSHTDFSQTNLEAIFVDAENFLNQYPNFCKIYRSPGFRLPCSDEDFSKILFERYHLTNFSSSSSTSQEKYFLKVPKIKFFNKSLRFGGTLFRLLPVRFLLKCFSQKYKIIYLHPRDLIGFYWQKNGSFKEELIHFLSFGSGFSKIETLIKLGHIASAKTFKPSKGFICE